jgi:LPXTG-motif cell wall-anchored protein
MSHDLPTLRRRSLAAAVALAIALFGLASWAPAAGAQQGEATGSAVVQPYAACGAATTSADLTVENPTQASVAVLVKMLDPDGGSDGNIDGEVVIVPAFDLAPGGTWTQTVTDLIPGDYRITLNGRRAPDNYNFDVAASEPCPPETTVTTPTSTPAGVAGESATGVLGASAQAAVPAQTLPDTGASTWVLAAIAVALVAVGRGLVIGSRRLAEVRTDS